MALSTATITYDLSDYGLADFDSRRTKVWATNNVNGPVVDTEGNTIHLGSANGTVNADGTGSITVPTPGTGSNPASWQTTIHVDYPDRNADRGRGRLSLGPFTITVSANLADLVDEQAVAPEYAGALVAQLEQIRDDTVQIAGIDSTDSAVAALVETPAGPLTQAALSATIATETADLATNEAVKFATKTAGYVLSSGGDTTTATIGVGGTGATIRYPAILPVPTTRWRLRIRNYDYKDTINHGSGTATFTGVWFGLQDFDAAGSPTGVFKTVAPTQALAGFTVTGTTAYTSGWVTDPALQFAADRHQLLSFGYTVSAGGAVARGFSGCWYATDQAQASVRVASGLSGANVGLFDIWIEYETESTLPRVLVIGDSLTQGRKAVGGEGNMNVSTWPVGYSLRQRVLATNGALSGTRLVNWSTTTNARWTKWTGMTFDAAIIALGRNDVDNADTLATLKTNFVAVVNAMRSFGVQKVYALTIPPNGFTSTKETNRTDFNTWLESLPVGISGAFNIGRGMSPVTDASLIDPAINSGDNVHFNAAGYHRMGNAIPALDPART